MSSEEIQKINARQNALELAVNNVALTANRLHAMIHTLECIEADSRLQALENIVYQHEKQEPIREPQQIPQFDPKILTEHQWKGKKLGFRQWADGSLAWGWDFIGEFPEEVIAILEKGSLTIGESVFTLGEKVVNVKKEGAK